MQNGGIFDQIGANEKATAPEQAGGVLKKALCLLRREIADGRAGKEADAPPGATRRRRQGEWAGEVGATGFTITLG